MHRHTGRSLLAKEISPEAERAIREFFRNFNDAIDPLREDIVEAIEEGDIDPSSLSSIEAEVSQRVGNYTNDVQVVYREGTENGLEVGREIASRVHQLDIAFDRVPENILREFEDWSDDIVKQEVMETLTDDTIPYIRTAHEEGLGIDETAQQVNDELFDGRLQDHVAERNARTATISSSNAGTHSAYEEADPVVGEEWIATSDNRTRDTHRAANGQVVAIGEEFVVGGHSAQYPGAPTLPIEELANCRCTTVPVFRDELTEDEFAQLQSGARIYRSDTSGSVTQP